MRPSTTSAPTPTATEATISTHTRTAAIRVSLRCRHNGPMRVVVTKVQSASVEVDGEVIAKLPRPGLLVLAGVGHDDRSNDAAALARKIWGLRILDDETSASDVDAPILVVSQFTLFASTRKGRRPGWSKAAPGPVSEPLVEELCPARTAGRDCGSGQVRRTHEGVLGQRRAHHDPHRYSGLGLALGQLRRSHRVALRRAASPARSGTTPKPASSPGPSGL